MAETIYTDKDYLDNQFLSIHKRLDTLESVPADLAVLKDWRKAHERGHSRASKIKLTLVGLLLSFAGILTQLQGP